MTNKAAVNVRETASIAVGIAAISQSVSQTDEIDSSLFSAAPLCIVCLPE